MNVSEGLVLFVLAIFFLYGAYNLVFAPVFTRRFYQRAGFEFLGDSSFEDIAESGLLKPLATKHLYSGTAGDRKILHAKSFIQRTRWLTFSKLQRKRLQTRWSTTIVKADVKLPEFTLLPKTEPETVMLMLENAGVNLEFDEPFARRYLLLTDRTYPVIELVTEQIREILMGPEVMSIEVIEDAVILKRLWPEERLSERVTQEVDCAVQIAGWLSERAGDTTINA